MAAPKGSVPWNAGTSQTSDVHTQNHHNGSKRSDQTKRSLLVTAQMREEIKRLRGVQSELLEALEKLVAECSVLHVAAIREGLGNTNAAVFTLRAQEARAAIAKARGGGK